MLTLFSQQTLLLCEMVGLLKLISLLLLNILYRFRCDFFSFCFFNRFLAGDRFTKLSGKTMVARYRTSFSQNLEFLAWGSNWFIKCTFWTRSIMRLLTAFAGKRVSLSFGSVLYLIEFHPIRLQDGGLGGPLANAQPQETIC